jgi:hypothetical protein
LRVCIIINHIHEGDRPTGRKAENPTVCPFIQTLGSLQGEAMNTYEKEKLEGYAKIITNFSNDTDTDQILTNYFNNIRATFNFSDVFIKQTQRIFPTQERFFGSFNNGEIELLRKIGERDEICHAITVLYMIQMSYIS